MKKGNRIAENIPEWQLSFFQYSVSISDKIKEFLTRKKMTTDMMAEMIGISKQEAKNMLSGCYDFNLCEMIKLEMFFSGFYSICEKKLLIEKI
jgi:DNA-binding XRE family transcriptional regulator